jgi:hypothetical protein
MEEYIHSKEEIVIVPVGMNYSDASVFRSRLYVNFGTPISFPEFSKRYAEDKVKAINEFTQFLENEMMKQIVVVVNPENDELYKAITEIYVRQWMQEERIDIRDQEAEHSKNQAIAGMINTSHIENPLLNESLKNLILPYLRALKELKLRDHLLRQDALSKMSVKSILNDFLILWFGLLPYWTGLLLNRPPYRLAQKLANDKVGKIEFYASVYANAGMIFWIVYYAIQLLFIRAVFHSWILSGIWALLVPLTGYYVLNFYPVMKKIFGRWRLLGLVKKNKAEAERLILEREEIIGMIRFALEKPHPGAKQD